jgi:hypothetical protein
MSATGTAIINFGTGANSTSVAVTGQSAIVSGSNVEAFFMYDTTSDHTANDHLYASGLMDLVCGNVVAGTGFTIYAASQQKIQGTFQVRWVWV